MEEIQKQLNERINVLVNSDPVAQRLVGKLEILQQQQQEEENDGDSPDNDGD